MAKVYALDMGRASHQAVWEKAFVRRADDVQLEGGIQLFGKSD